MQTIPKEMIKNANQLTSKEAICLLYHYRENKLRSYNDVKTEFRDIGIPIKIKAIKRQIERMVKNGLMTYAEHEGEKRKGGLKPRAYRLSDRGRIEAEEIVKSLLKKFGGSSL